jgi:Tfp pilus assembly protein PilN
MYDEDIEKRVQQYLDEIESVMKQPYSEKAEVLQNIEAHIHDALNRKSEGSPTIEDLEAVIAEMDTPESYGNESGANGKGFAAKTSVVIVLIAAVVTVVSVSYTNRVEPQESSASSVAEISKPPRQQPAKESAADIQKLQKIAVDEALLLFKKDVAMPQSLLSYLREVYLLLPTDIHLCGVNQRDEGMKISGIASGQKQLVYDYVQVLQESKLFASVNMGSVNQTRHGAWRFTATIAIAKNGSEVGAEETMGKLRTFEQDEHVGAVFLSEIENIANECNLRIDRSEVREKSEVGGIHQMYVEIGSCEGRPSAFVNFLYAIQAKGRSMNAKHIFIKDSADPKKATGRLSIVLSYEKE